MRISFVGHSNDSPVACRVPASEQPNLKPAEPSESPSHIDTSNQPHPNNKRLASIELCASGSDTPISRVSRISQEGPQAAKGVMTFLFSPIVLIC